MAITFKKAQELQIAWGDKPCTHPSFTKEVYGGVTPTGYNEVKTGDYICTQCGKEFTKSEKEKIENNR